jgi:NADH dehydrogenase FAD-containing subunit
MERIMPKHLVLAGGGHAHMVTLANLERFTEKGHKVTVIGPSPFHYYSGMGPGLLGKFYSPEEIRFATKHVVEVRGGDFIQASVSHINPEKKEVFLNTGEIVPYDVISFNTGSQVPHTMITENNGDIYSVKPIEKLLEAQNRILEISNNKDVTIAVVGGGPAALEVTGNIWRLAKYNARGKIHIQLFAGKHFLPRLKEKIRKKAIESLSARSIEILEKGYVKEVKTGSTILESGETYKTDFIILAHGVKPSPIFKKSSLPIGPDGGLIVNRFLQCTDFPEIFGGGDCIYFQDQPLDKVGVYAVRENPILFHNLTASMEGTALKPFIPGKNYLLVFNMGDGTGILTKKWLTISGKTAFIIKDYIDRKFMKKFQAIE